MGTGIAVRVKVVSEGAGEGGGEDNTDCEEGVLNGYAGTVGTDGFEKVGNCGTAGTVNRPGSEEGAAACP
jgi:hypothetical protein